MGSKGVPKKRGKEKGPLSKVADSPEKESVRKKWGGGGGKKKEEKS